MNMTDFIIMSLFQEHFNPLSVLEFKHYTEKIKWLNEH